jgi:hypothetical protein
MRVAIPVRRGASKMNADEEREALEAAGKESRGLLVLKRAVEVVGWLAALALLAFAGHAVFA